ncbi:precorrin-6Y C5,15-methyltransferase (decarboxylating) subunit CbiT [Clostridiaceae bacterium M8S5]|nr:precorrin-6Y C5,15-methyltransferase (decarboxylating) subunit CbiT [Clostridiaceae bacterium M8S5]
MHFGLEDELFIRGNAPMTKSEIRAITLSKLQIQENSKVVDIGAGTGSITVECGLNSKKGIVYAIEKKVEAIELIKQNIEKFQLDNIRIYHSTASTSLPHIKDVNRIIVGGSGGELGYIVKWANHNLDGIIVANFICIENLYEFIQLLKKYSFKDIEVVQAHISRGKNIGSLTMMMSNNPVFIVTAKKWRV